MTKKCWARAKEKGDFQWAASKKSLWIVFLYDIGHFSLVTCSLNNSLQNKTCKKIFRVVKNNVEIDVNKNNSAELKI